jgi:hypothetical protein
MALYKKKFEEELEDETASYDELEKTIWSDNKKSGRKSRSIPRK